MRLLICGILGRMGKVTQDLIEEAEGLTVAAGVDSGFDSLGSGLPSFKNGYALYSSIVDCKTHFDCAISFLPPTASGETFALLNYCAESKKPVVICTTGLCEKVLGKINETSQKTAVLHSANMSYGINLINGLLEKISKKLFDAGFDIEIVEKHHSGKIDCPSGTANMLADTINSSLGGNMEIVHDRSREHNKRGQNEIGVFALRGGGINGDHSIMFASATEVIELSHSALNRSVFASGAVKAAKYLLGKEPGLYTMKNLIGVD